MGTRAPITINDGATTPVAHTFNPTQDNQKGVSFFYDRSGGIAAGYPYLTVSLSEPPALSTPAVKSGSDRRYRADVRIYVPSLETVSNNSAGYTPAPKAAYFCAFKGEFMIPERATQQNRKDLLAYCKNLLGHAVVTSLIVDLEGVY